MESVCPFFLRGSCHFGRRCWNSHVIRCSPNQRPDELQTTLAAPTTIGTVSAPVQLPAISSNAPAAMRRVPRPAASRSAAGEDTTVLAPNVGGTVLNPFQIPETLRSAPRIIGRRVPRPAAASRSAAGEDTTVLAPNVGGTVLNPFQIPETLRSAPRIINRRVPRPAAASRSADTTLHAPTIRTVSTPTETSTSPRSDTSSEAVIGTDMTGPREDNDVVHEIDQCVKIELMCHICQDTFIKPTVINCSHTFCFRCIYTWTTKVRQCPLCRETVTNMALCRSLDAFLEKINKHLPEETK